MIRTGAQHRNLIRDGRQVWINGERVKDVTTHPMFRPLVDVRARIYDMQHAPNLQTARYATAVRQARSARSPSSCRARATTGTPKNARRSWQC